MTDRREALVQAAISVLAAGGSRSLTHRAVDAAAGVPAGATSNCFRTRADLLAGVLEEILAAETEHYARLPVRPGPDGLARDVATMVEHLAGPAHDTTVARLALALEAAWDPELATMIDRGRRVWWEITVDRLGALGVVDADAGADGLLALVDGLVLDRLRGGGGPGVETIARALIAGLTKLETASSRPAPSFGPASPPRSDR